MSEPDRPEPDRIEGAPHPRDAERLFGQAAAEAGFLEAFNSGRMHSGWLLTGPKGVGKATLAWRIAGFLLAQPVAEPGGLFGDAPPRPDRLDLPSDHPDRRLILSGAHPRLKLIRRPWDDKTDRLKAEITVDAVRELKSFFQMSAADGGRRVVIVDAADELNRNAANAILKELEEPPAKTTLLLVAHQPSRLLPTIRSRCRELRLSPLAPGDMADALNQAGIPDDSAEAMAALANGSVGEAVRLSLHDGLPLYSDLVKLISTFPRIDRASAIRLADSCTGKTAETRYRLVTDLMLLLIGRAARAGVMGEPHIQGAPGEARLLAKLSPTDRAARRWAGLQQDLDARIRHGRAVNLDPAALILDMIFKIEETAQGVAAA